MREDEDKRVSMHGVDPVEALRALLKVDPKSSPVDDEKKKTGRDEQQQDDEGER